MDEKIEIFVSYSHQDAEYLEKNALLGFLKGLEREGVEFWTDRKLEAGETWDGEIRARIRGSDLALLLVSQAFLDSRYCSDVEVRSFLKKSHEDGLRIVPILLSPCEWERHEWLSSLQALPGDGRTIEEDYSDPGKRKRLFLEIRRQLREQIEEIRGRKADDSPKILTLAAGERPPKPPREASLLGRTLSHYRILDPLGAGGIGEVYVAEDSLLHHKVALKVLPRELAADPGRLERLEREATALAALNHPNIITVYSVEQADGVRFFTMELVAGKTLGQVIPQGGLGLEQLLALAVPLADALSAAHERGITHRDLKPANVMVSDEGRVKVPHRAGILPRRSLRRPGLEPRATSSSEGTADGRQGFQSVGGAASQKVVQPEGGEPVRRRRRGARDRGQRAKRGRLAPVQGLRQPGLPEGVVLRLRAERHHATAAAAT